MCPGMQKESVHNILRASLISLFSSSGAIFLCFHMEIYRSININGNTPYGLRRKRITTKIADQAFEDIIFFCSIAVQSNLEITA